MVNGLKSIPTFGNFQPSRNNFKFNNKANNYNSNFNNNNNNSNNYNDNSNNEFYPNEVKKSNEYLTSQENTNLNRNRFHPLSSTKSPRIAITPTTTTTATTTTSTTTAPETTSIESSNNSFETDATVKQNRLGKLASRFTARGQNYSVKVHKLPRQPLFNSREIIESTPVTEQAMQHINVTHNGSSFNDDAETESYEYVDSSINDDQHNVAETNNRDSSDSKVNQKPNTESELETVSQVNETEDEVSVEEESTTKSNGDDQSKANEQVSNNENITIENEPVILTSNFFLPGKTSDSEEQQGETEVEGEVTDGKEEGYAVEETVDEGEQPSIKSGHDNNNGSLNTGRSNENLKNPQEAEYEYDYEDYGDETTPEQNLSVESNREVDDRPNNASDESIVTKEGIKPLQNNKSSNVLGKEVVSVVTTTSVINGSTSNPGQLEYTKPYENINVSTAQTPTDNDENNGNTTESYVVVASVQTSRSISGARFLPFPQVEQEEKKQVLSDLERDAEGLNDNYNKTDDLSLFDDLQITTTRPEETTITSAENVTQTAVTESASDSKNKNHKLSTVSEKLAHLHEKIDNTEITTKPNPVVIRKFTPRTKPTTTSKPKQEEQQPNKVSLDNLPEDDLSGLLPTGFKYRQNSYKNKKITTTTEQSVEETEGTAPPKNIKSKIIVQDPLEGLLPKGYKLNASETTEKPKITELLNKLKFEDNLESLLPKDFKTSPRTTKAPLSLSTVTDDISKFLPPGYKLPKSATKKPTTPAPITDAISKFLPPGYKLPNSEKATEESTTSAKPTAKSHSPVLIVKDDISKFLPPGYKPPANEKEDTLPKIIKIEDDISKFLPPGYKLNSAESTTAASAEQSSSVTESILKKIQFNSNLGNLLPPGFAQNDTNDNLTPKPTSASPSFKVVFPKSIHKRPGTVGRMTTSKPSVADGPSKSTSPAITIRKGLPTR